MPSLVLALLAAAGAYGVLLAALYFGQSALLYLPNLPSRTLAATPAAIGLDYETVHFETEDRVRLHGWFIPAKKPRNTLLFFHGNAGNISHRLDSVRIFHDLGLSVLIFDYRGYGRSEGRPSEKGTRLDARAAWRHLTEVYGIEPQRVVLFGRSLGAALAAWLATQAKPGALILESAFTSVPKLAAELYWWLPARRLARLNYPTRAYLKDVHCPVLVIHSSEDEIIPYHHGQALYAAAHPPRSFLKLRGDHNTGFLLSGERYVGGLDHFLQRHLPAAQ
ncbi:MAG: alpha/beta hydrolase [Methylohalobius crimeensis]